MKFSEWQIEAIHFPFPFLLSFSLILFYTKFLSNEKDVFAFMFLYELEWDDGATANSA